MFRFVVTTIALMVCLDNVMAANKCYSCEHTVGVSGGNLSCYDNFKSSAFEATCGADQMCQVSAVKALNSDDRFYVSRSCISIYDCYHGCQRGSHEDTKDTELCVTCCDSDLCNIGNGSTGVISSILPLFVFAGLAIFTLV
ncbi:uncharacterized protein [Ptychodera flava]|uniref:uncharacterized protein n=1 Tax=Ptychodera flava TaxID=63121 RepID=UPI003969BE39